MNASEPLREIALREGAVLFGTAEVGSHRGRFLLSDAEAGGLDFAVSVAVALSRAVLAGNVDRPTLLYKWHYQQANNLLDRIAFRLAHALQEAGHRALPVPASQLVDWEAHRGHVSHRAVAEAAGLGWRGRNNLIVTPRYGAGVRFATVLTDLPLPASPPAAFGCGACRACVDACPASALGESAADYRLDRCVETLTGFSRQRGIGVHICGVCVRTCPAAVA
jgi:epoxyqueuosine reductase QueG